MICYGIFYGIYFINNLLCGPVPQPEIDDHLIGKMMMDR